MLEKEDFSKNLITEKDNQSDLAVFDIESPFITYNLKVKFDAESVSSANEGFFAIKKDGKYFFLNSKNGKVSKKYDLVGTFYRGEAKVLIGQKWYVVNSDFEIIF